MSKPLLTDSGCVSVWECLGCPRPALLPRRENGWRGAGGCQEDPLSFAKPAGTGLPCNRRDLRTAGLRSSSPGAMTLTHLPTPPLPRHTRSTWGDWAPLPRQSPAPRPPGAEQPGPLSCTPTPRPLPRLQMASPCARLAAPRRRPAAAGGRSLPPSCCSRDRGHFARRTGSSAGSDWGGSAAAEGPAVAALTGKEPHSPQVRKPRGRRRAGKEEPERSGTQPSLFLDLPPLCPFILGAEGGTVSGPEHPREAGSGRTAARRGRQHPGAGATGLALPRRPAPAPGNAASAAKMPPSAGKR